MAQENQRSKWFHDRHRENLQQNLAGVIEASTNLLAAVSGFSPDSNQPSLAAISQENGMIIQFLLAAANGNQFDSQSFQWANQEAVIVNVSIQGPPQSSVVLNSATVEFIPNPVSPSPTTLSQTLSTGNISVAIPISSAGQAIITLDTSITSLGLEIPEPVFYEGDGEYWTDDEIFVPKFCKNKRPELVAPRPIRQEIERVRPRNVFYRDGSGSLALL
jgi:hypothetical protein